MGTTSAPTRWLDRDQQRSWRAYVMGTTLLLDKLDRELRKAHDISLPEYEILVRLSEIPSGRMRMALLADAMSHSRSRVTHTITRMERADLVQRSAAECDGRGVEAVMTEHGRALLEKAAHTHVRGVREHLVDLTDADDFRATGRLMDAVCDHLMPGHPQATDIR